MAAYVYPSLAQLELVGLLRVPFETATINLISSPIALTPATTIAELTAIVATFSGYAAVTLTAIPAPYLDPINGGVSQVIPTTQFNTASPTTITNSIWGGWLQDAAGNLLMAWTTTNGWAMNSPSLSLPLQLVLNWYGTGAVYVSYGDVPQ